MTITKSSNQFVALVAGVAVAAALVVGVVAAPQAQAAALTQAQVNSIISLLQSFGADAATIANVQASLTGGTPSTPSTPSTGGACPALSRDLQQGSSGSDVMALQKFLNGSADTMVAASGAGSPGNETSTFGPATKAAVIKFQTKRGVSPAAGYVGAKTRAAIAAVCGGSVSTPVPTGPGLSVSAGAQPANALAPSSANRVPFTTFMLTNNSGVAQTVTGVTVQRVGPGIDNNFSGIVLLDATNNVQIGTSKTLNSNHQATIGDTFTINPGQSMTLTVAGNIANSSTAQSGQIVALQVVAVNTSAAVSGSLPINGASHTINTTLTLGSVSTSTSSFDPGAAQTKSIGDTAVRIAAVRFTAGSAEDLKLYNIRWRQVGTASASDISNVQVDVNGTKYPATVDSSGKYYTVQFPGGLSIAKGNSIDVYIQTDISGSNSASRTVKFDIDKVTDVYFVGQTYGYGIAPSGTYTPWLTLYTTTINAGSATTIGKATEVPAQNIAANVSNQVLGGFVTDFKGEAVTITSLPITIATSSNMSGVITGISLVNENGAVVAGPVDEASTCTTGCTVTFTDSITFPTGRHIWTIKGKIPSGASNGSTVIVTTVPSNWGSPTGQTSGNSITISQGTFDMNTMTVQAAALKIALSTTPASQNIVGGGQRVHLANLQLDASQSGEDVRISSVPIILTLSTMVISEITSCQVYDNTTALNTGSNVPSSIAASGSATTYTFDNTLTVTKGTVKTLSLKCDIASSVSSNDSVAASISNNAANWSSTGVTSGSSITETFGNTSGGTMTVQTGSLTVTVDSSSPGTTTVASGSTGVTMTVVKLRAANEAMTLSKLGLVLTGSGNTLSTASGGSTSSGVSDLVQVYVYDGATLVGTATFTDTTTLSATSTLSSSVSLPKDTDKLLTVKADLASIGTGQAGGIGDSVIINPLNAEASGQNSGTTIRSGATIGAAGIKLFKSYPTLALDTLPTTGAADGRLMRFKVTANAAGPVGINEFTFTVSSTTGVTITTVRLKAYTDSSYSNAISGQDSGGQIGSDTGNIVSGSAFEIVPSTNPVQVPAGSTVYFELTGAVTGMDTGDSIVTTLNGDSSALADAAANNGYNLGTTTSSGEVGSSTVNFVWSGNSSTTAARADVDWSNGFNIPGLPSGGLIQTRSN